MQRHCHGIAKAVATIAVMLCHFHQTLKFKTNSGEKLQSFGLQLPRNSAPIVSSTIVFTCKSARLHFALQAEVVPMWSPSYSHATATESCHMNIVWDIIACAEIVCVLHAGRGSWRT